MENNLPKLPIDIIRHIYKIRLEDEPLFIFTFNEEMFQLGEYEPYERVALIFNCLKVNYERTKDSFFNTRNENVESIKNLKANILPILNLIKDYVNIENIKYIYRDESMSNIYFKNVKLFDFECIKWICSFSELIETSNLCLYSIIVQDFEMAKYIYETKKPSSLDVKMTSDYCIQNNNLEMLKWVCSLDPPCLIFPYSFTIAANENNYEILEWLISRDEIRYWDESLTFIAIANNDLKMLKWLIEKNACIDTGNCSFEIISQNNFEILEFLYNHDPSIYLDEIFCHYSSSLNNLEMLKWFRTRNPPFKWDKEECLKLCTENEIKRWIELN